MRTSRRSVLEIEALKEKPASAPKEKPRRVALPASFPRREIAMSPRTPTAAAAVGLERIGEDVSEKLDYTPGVFEVERHVRGKWVCRSLRAAGPGAGAAAHHRQGNPDGGLLAQVLVAKYLDHAPLYRQEGIFDAPASRCRARPWRSGWAPAACSCSRWSKR